MTQPAPAAPPGISPEQPEIGSVFVSNYPPFGAWSPESLPDVHAALDAPPRPGTPLGPPQAEAEKVHPEDSVGE